MATYLEILNNHGMYPDVMELALPNGERTTVGQAREALAAERARLAADGQAVQRARVELSNVFAVLDEERRDLETQKARFEEQRSMIRTETGDETADLPPNAQKRLASLEQTLAETKAALDKVQKDSFAMAKTYVDDKWNQELDGVTVPDGITKQDLIRLAVKDSLLDEHGLPSLKRAVDKLTEPARREKELAAAREEGRQQAIREQAMASVGSPGSGMFGAVKGPGDEAPKKYKTIEKAIEAATQDPEIMASLAGVTTAF